MTSRYSLVGPEVTSSQDASRVSSLTVAVSTRVARLGSIAKIRSCRDVGRSATISDP
jgi:hypothetical protein